MVSIIQHNLLLEKAHIYKKLPSQHSPLRKKIDSFLKLLAKPFNFKKPSSDHSWARIVNLKGEDKHSFLTLNNFIKAHRDFLKHDSKTSASLAKAFDKMEQDEKEIQKLHHSISLFSNKKVDEEKKEKIAAKLVAKRLNEIKNLKKGETLLFTLERHGNTPKQILIIEKRDQDQYEMSWIDSDKELAIKKYDVSPSIFEKPELQELFSQWTSPTGIPKTEFEEFITTNNIKETSSEKLTNRVDKLFWRIVSNVSHQQEKQSRISADAYLLFKYFAKNQSKLTPTSREYFILRQLHEAVAARVAQGAKKHNIDDKELATYVEELKIIEEALSQVKASKSSIPSSKAPSEKIRLEASPFQLRIAEPIPVDELKRNELEKKVISDFQYVGEKIKLERSIELKDIKDLKAWISKGQTLFEEREGISPELRKHQLLSWIQYIPYNFKTVNTWEKLSVQETLELQNWLIKMAEELYGDLSIASANQYELRSFNKISWLIHDILCPLVIDPQSISPLNPALLLEERKIAEENKSARDFFSNVTNLITPDGYSWRSQDGFRYIDRAFIMHVSEADDFRWDNPATPQKYVTLDILKQKSAALKKLNQLIAKVTHSERKSPFRFLETDKNELASFIIPENQHNLVKPFQNGYLMGLYYFAKNSEKGPASTPESFQAQPYEALDEKLDELNKFLRKLRKEDVSSHVLDKPELDWSKDEIQKILRVLARDNFSPELAAFMVESPELMLNTEIRNFLEALFFYKIDMIEKDSGGHKKNKTEISDYVDQALQKALQEMQASFENEQDPASKYKKLEATLYYYEFHEKFRQLLDPSSKIASLKDSNEFNQLVDQIKQDSKLQPLLGYAARIKLRQQVGENLQTLDANQISTLIQTYCQIFRSGMDPQLTDPYFEKYKERLWIDLISKIGDQKIDFSPVLDSICQGNRLTAGEDPWENVEGFIYQNDLYTIDLITRKVSSLQQDQVYTMLPMEIFNHPELKSLELADTPAFKIGNRYQLTDPKGTPILIQKEGDQLAIFKKLPFEKDTWLQQIQLEPKKEAQGIFAQFKKLINPHVQKRSLLDQCQIYINPDKPKEGYAVDKEGKLLFKLQLGTVKKGFEVKAAADQRQGPSTDFYQFTSSDKLHDHRFFALEGIEKPENMIVWSKKGKIQTIELPRYNLSFALVRGQLVCKSKGFENYVVDPEADLKEYQGLKHLLVLRSKDEKKPVRLVVPSASSLKQSPMILKPEASGLGHLRTPLYYAGKLYDFTKGIFENEVMLNLEIDSTKDQIEYVTFEIQPFTHELIGKEEQTELLELMEQAVKLNNPVAALNFYRKIDLSKLSVRQMQPILDFLNSFTTEDALPLKLKIALEIHQHLQKRKQLSSSLDENLKKMIKTIAPEVAKMGIRVAEPLRISAEESEILFEQISQELIFDASKFPDKIEKLDLPAQDFTPHIELLKAPTALLFTKEEVDPLFNIKDKVLPDLNVLTNQELEPCELKGLEEFQDGLDYYKRHNAGQEYTLNATKKELKTFVTKQIIPKTRALEKELAEKEAEILSSVRSFKTASENIRLLAQHQKIASIDELRIAFAKGKLEALQAEGKIAKEVDIDALKKDLLNYFDLLSQRNASKAALRALEDAITKYGTEEKEWTEISKGVYHLLSLERQYDPELDPRLLIFEAQQFKNFKLLEGGLEQIDLINTLLTSENSLIAAPTGAGKTSVISVIQTLKKATGENLVVQKVLPQLFDQTYDQLKSTMGDLLGSYVMKLQFDLKSALITSEIDENGESISVSSFKKLYNDLEETIANRSCILTDYKSIPLLEEFFWKNADQILSAVTKKELAIKLAHENFSGMQLKQKLAEAEQENQIDPVLLEHHQYLRKILKLVQSGDINMDEPDEKCRPNQSIQIDLGAASGGKIVAQWMQEIVLEAYEELFNIEELKLSSNLQAEISSTARKDALEKFRAVMAEKYCKKDDTLKQQLLDYFSETNEDILGSLDKYTPEEADKIAFIKNLCRKRFFNMITSKKEGSDYTRNKTGRGVVVCHSQRPQPSRHGTLEEQLCYLAQDYLYKGITHHDLINGLKPLLENNAPELATFFPDYPLTEIKDMMKHHSGKAELISLINKNIESKKYFLQLALASMKTSGKVISMNPQNILDMSDKNSGVSATLNAPESLPSNIKVDTSTYSQVKANMAYRIVERAGEDPKVIPYDPMNPEEAIQSTTSCILDGAGAFKDPEKAAEALLNKNSQLKKVVFNDFDGEEKTIGSSEQLKETGAVYPQALTRGKDRVLDKNTKALMTTNDKTGIRAFFQIEGRLRDPTQQYQLAMPEDQLKEGATLQSIIRDAVLVDAKNDAKDIFTHITQAIKGVARKTVRDKLLELDEIEDFLDLFKKDEISDLFIGKPQTNYEKNGDYFKNHKHIAKTAPPKEIFELLIEKEKEKFPQIEQALDELEVSDELLIKMEKEEVIPPDNSSDELGHELEIEEEMDVEEQQEQESELEFDVEEEQSRSTVQGKFPHRDPNLAREQLQHAIGYYKPQIVTFTHYDDNISYSGSFLPLYRNQNKSAPQRAFFDDAMYRVGMVRIREDINKDVFLEIKDPILNNSEINYPHYDVRTKIFYGTPPQDLNRFYRLIAQVKIFDGCCNGWSPEELAGLKQWIHRIDKKGILTMAANEVKDHLVNEVLKNRPNEFANSQLDLWFKNKGYR